MQTRLYILVLLLTVFDRSGAEPDLGHCDPELIPNEGGMQTPVVDALSFDENIAALLNEFGLTPGLAVGVVVNDQIVYSRGFGYRDLATCTPVTVDTSFYLLSVTKSFTGMVAALLEKQGDWELDKSLGEYFPELTMPDGINANQISMRDLLNHRPGFWNGGINYRASGPGNLSDQDILHLLAKHSRPYPIQFEYSNMGYVVAAAVMLQQTGKPWPVLLEEMIFEPIGMENSTTSINKARAGNFAKPYRINSDGRYQAMPIKVQSQMHAAGGAASSVSDLLRWVRINLAIGEIDGKQVFPKEVVRQAHSPQIQYNWRYYKFDRFAYGLGVHNSDYEGDLLIHHFGGPIHVSFMPEHGIGVVVLTNGTGPSTAFSHMTAAFVYDSLLEKPGVREKYAMEVQEISASAMARTASNEKADKDLRGNRVQAIDPDDASVFNGLYVSDRLGAMEVALREDGLWLQYGVLSSPLEFVGNDSFLVRLGADQGLDEFRFVAKDGEFRVLDWNGRLFERAD